MVRVVLYSHQPEDTQSRSEASFEVTLVLDGLDWKGPARVEQFQFDREHNSPFKAARTLRDRPKAGGAVDAARLTALIRDLEGADRAAQREALARVHELDSSGRQAVMPAILKLAGQDRDAAIRDLAKDVIKTMFAPAAYARAEIERIQKLCECRATGKANWPREGDGPLCVTTRVLGNGCVFLKIGPAGGRGAG